VGFGGERAVTVGDGGPGIILLVRFTVTLDVVTTRPSTNMS
jgi:hypothetical protein